MIVFEASHTALSSADSHPKRQPHAYINRHLGGLRLFCNETRSSLSSPESHKRYYRLPKTLSTDLLLNRRSGSSKYPLTRSDTFERDSTVKIFHIYQPVPNFDILPSCLVIRPSLPSTESPFLQLPNWLPLLINLTAGFVECVLQQMTPGSNVASAVMQYAP